jgi:DNA-binding NtrC family response regulator
MRSPVVMDGAPGEISREAIIGRSRSMQDVYKAIGRVSSTEATVLIRGESGTGKELVARAVYSHSLRADKPFQVINCVAIPESLLESELFGFEKGAFTGAAHRRVGKIEQAHGGTVFLDEIGDMPFGIQSKILRLLQEKSIERLGGRETIPVDVRIIAATNRDLEAALQRGRFREDLYYRLKVVTISLPPLRQRADDIPLLADYFLARYAAELDMDNPGITKEAVAVLLSHTWPGNVRELANTIQKGLIFNRGAPIQPQEILQAVGAGIASGAGASLRETDQVLRQWARETISSRNEVNKFDAIMDHFASILVGEALNMTRGNRSQAARLLGLSRPTLHSKIEKYRLRLKTSVEDDSPA